MQPMAATQSLSLGEQGLKSPLKVTRQPHNYLSLSLLPWASRSRGRGIKYTLRAALMCGSCPGGAIKYLYLSRSAAK